MLDDFIIRFPESKSNGLFESWNKINANVKAMEWPKFDDDLDDIDNDINNFLMILKKLEPKRVSFKNTVDNFIIFNKVRVGFT